MGEPFRPVAPVDPTNLRPMLFLDVARQIMLSPDWTHRAVSVVMASHTGPGRFAFYGANRPDIGGVRQPPLPLERMVREAPDTPLDVPMHPSAADVWRQHGFL
jgi:hypothetical protein